MNQTESKPLDFIRAIVAEDVAAGKHGGRIATRFPPEPNAYLHVGHAKAIGIDFGIAAEYGGVCHLRFDDTNPTREEQEYIDAIREDLRWLGFDWGEHEYFASDYFGQLYEWACKLIREGKAYVDDQSADDIRKSRGSLTAPGTESPFRNRSAEENLDLFERMKKGEFPNGSRVLRARIDMAAPNLNLRDPVMYRIMHTPHHRTGDTWCIYPTYDYAHGQSDSIEKITHSLCSLEFEDHRPLYNWFIEQLGIFPSRQIEFARGNITYMVTSKRKLLELVEGGFVEGMNDPRMPTLRGLRRRGYTPEAIRTFWEEAGVAKRVNNINFSKLESTLRDDLNKRALRRLAVLDPIKVVITNLPEDHDETLEATNNHEDPSAGSRQIPFSNELFIEREDFMENPPGKFFRLAPGREVRLRYAYLATCNEVVKDSAGHVTELRCTIDLASRGGNAPDGRKVKGTIHWVCAKHAVDAEVRLYEHLFLAEDPTTPPAGSENWLDNVNRESLKVIPQAKLEPALKDAKLGEAIQFERLGYFCVDTDSNSSQLVFNRTVTLRDTWAKVAQGGGSGGA